METRVATFAAGCFWGVEAAYMDVPGVLSTSAGYTGGTTVNPSYEEVCAGFTGHAEAVRIEYDPNLVSFDGLLEVFWRIHDPTTPGRQGPDVGDQYRSAIFYHDDMQKESARESREKKQKDLKKQVVTEISPAGPFYPAEEYHQKYLKKKGLRP